MISRLLRFSTLIACVVLTLVSAIALTWSGAFWLPLVIFGALAALGIYDMLQSRHAILRNYPILGHLRYFFEMIRPEIRP